MRRARVDSALYFDLSHEDGEMGDDMDDISSMGGAQKLIQEFKPKHKPHHQVLRLRDQEKHLKQVLK
jgi:hypothetical protein